MRLASCHEPSCCWQFLHTWFDKRNNNTDSYRTHTAFGLPIVGTSWFVGISMALAIGAPALLVAGVHLDTQTWLASSLRQCKEIVWELAWS